MRKIITCMGLATSLMAAAPAMSQTRVVTNQEKEAFVRAAIPAMLEQVKQISGIDIVGLANPTIGEVIASPLFGTESMLRAAEKQPLSIQPDSMTVNLGAISPEIGTIMPNIVIRFSDYKAFGVTTTDQRKVTISVPKRISASALGMEVGLNLSFGDKKGLLPFSTFTANLDLGGFGEVAGAFVPGLKSGELVSMTETSKSATYTYDVKLGAPLKAIVGKFEPEQAKALPDFRVNVDLSALPKDTVKANLQGVFSTGTVLPMGDATVIFNDKEEYGSLFAGRINLTSYKKGTAAKEKDEMILRIRKIKGETITLQEQTYVYSKEENGWISEELTYTDFKGNHPVDEKALAYSIVGGILTDLQSGKADPYTITKTEFPGGNHIENGGKITDKISIIPSMVGMQAAKFDIQFEDNDNGQLEKTMLITVNMPVKGDKITVDFHPAKYEAPISTLYLNSNAMGIITDNETIEENVAPKLTVSSTGSGLYVQHGKGNYAVINMVGKVIARGQITSDDAYLTIPNLTNGIYMISIDKADGSGRETVKFMR